jgi:hypothetical protein
MVPKEKYIEFFQSYENLRKEHNFQPEFIFNIDETMVDVISNPTKIILFKDDLDPVIPEEKKLEHMTLLLTLPVEGDPIRPLVILPLKTVPQLNPKIRNYFDLSGQQSGWITGEILQFWLENQFLQQITQRRAKYGQNSPVLVILDNHSSRRSIQETRMWVEHKIKFLFIPPHTSHVIQPLDKCPNFMYKKLLGKAYIPHPNDCANIRRNRVRLASIPSLETALSASYRDSGWRGTGLYPFHPERIIDSPLVAPTINDEKPVLEETPKNKRIKFQVGNEKKGETVKTVVLTLSEV